MSQNTLTLANTEIDRRRSMRELWLEVQGGARRASGVTHAARIGFGESLRTR